MSKKYITFCGTWKQPRTLILTFILITSTPLQSAIIKIHYHKFQNYIIKSLKVNIYVSAELFKCGAIVKIAQIHTQETSD